MFGICVEATALCNDPLWLCDLVFWCVMDDKIQAWFQHNGPLFQSTSKPLCIRLGMWGSQPGYITQTLPQDGEHSWLISRLLWQWTFGSQHQRANSIYVVQGKWCPSGHHSLVYYPFPDWAKTQQGFGRSEENQNTSSSDFECVCICFCVYEWESFCYLTWAPWPCKPDIVSLHSGSF